LRSAFSRSVFSAAMSRRESYHARHKAGESSATYVRNRRTLENTSTPKFQLPTPKAPGLGVGSWELGIDNVALDERDVLE